MKYFYAFLVVLVLLNFFFCQENTKTDGESNKDDLKQYIDSLKEIKEYTQEELKEVFRQIFYRSNDDPEKLNNQTLLNTIDQFAEEVFEKLANKERHVLVVEEAFKNFDYNAVRDYISEFLETVDLRTLLHKIMTAVVKGIMISLLKYFGDEDL